MINITGIINDLQIDTTVYLYKETLSYDFYQSKNKWYDGFGRFAGDTAKEVVEKYKLEPITKVPHSYYAVDSNASIPDNVLKMSIHETTVIGLYDGGATYEEITNV